MFSIKRLTDFLICYFSENKIWLNAFTKDLGFDEILIVYYKV